MLSDNALMTILIALGEHKRKYQDCPSVVAATVRAIREIQEYSIQKQQEDKAIR